MGEVKSGERRKGAYVHKICHYNVQEQQIVTCVGLLRLHCSLLARI